MSVAKFREDVEIIISGIEEHLKHSDVYARRAAMELLSRLAEQGMC